MRPFIEFSSATALIACRAGDVVRKVYTKRYNKQVPGHHIQMDVKFLMFKGKAGKKIKRYQYTAIDDATRVSALKVYQRHTQANAIDFVDHIIEKLPFRIQQVRTDNGHEFQAKLHFGMSKIRASGTPTSNRAALSSTVKLSDLTDLTSRNSTNCSAIRAMSI